MTINEAINALDAGKNNTFSRQDKLGWLSRVDGMIYQELHKTHDGSQTRFSGYTDQTDPNLPLLVPAPWDEIYLHYMQAQMDYLSGDMTRYANAAALYNAGFAAYRNYFNRTHCPKGRQWQYF